MYEYLVLIQFKLTSPSDLVDATYLQEFEYNVHGNNAYDIILTDNNFKVYFIRLTYTKSIMIFFFR